MAKTVIFIIGGFLYNGSPHNILHFYYIKQALLHTVTFDVRIKKRLMGKE